MDKWIHVFHMPMFFIVSGFFYKEQRFSTIIKKRFRTLLVPYFTFGLIHLFIHFIGIGSVDCHAFYLLLWENTADNGIPIAGALWFLTAMFFSELLFWCVQRYRISTLWTTVIAGLIAVSGMSFAAYLPFRLPWAIDVGMVGVGLYQIGKLLREKWAMLMELKLIYSLISVILFSILGVLSPNINLRMGRYGIWPMFWINAVGMTLSLWIFSQNVYERVKDNKILRKPLTWIKSIGRESIVYLCLNQLAILIAGKLVGRMIPSGGIVFFVITKTLILIFALTELLVLQKVIIGTKLRAVVGK